MASFNIHLAIGKQYIEKRSQIKNKDEFYKGIIAPDLVENKAETHYSGQQDKDDLLYYLSKKVQLEKFIEKEKIDTDYQKGVFLHLITDYLFFNKFFEKKYLSNVTYEEFCQDLYYSYDQTNKYIEKEYKINNMIFVQEISKNIQKSKKEKNITDEKRTNIISIKKIDEFIDLVSSIDLEQYKEQINKNEKLMKEALKEAQKAYNKEEVPVGAIIIKDGKIIARAHNQKETKRDTTKHAEIIAIQKASKKIEAWRLANCEMYVTLEPCSMCAGALIQSRIKKIYIGTMDYKTGACGSKLNLLEDFTFNHKVEIETGILQEECEKILQDFFKKLRKMKK